MRGEFNKTTSKNGFTLIELVIVIGIIGILAGSTIIAYGKVINLAKIVVAKHELKEMKYAIILAESRTGKTLGQITGNWCSGCACFLGNTHGPGNPSCILGWDNARVAISNALNGELVLPPRDPWGSPYLIDENEGEFGPTGTNCGACCNEPGFCDFEPIGNPDNIDDRDANHDGTVDVQDTCRADAITSAGPNRKYWDGDDISFTNFGTDECNSIN